MQSTAIENVWFYRKPPSESAEQQDATQKQIDDADIQGLGVHALNCSQPSSLADFIVQHEKYERDFPECPCPPVEDLLEDLAKMIRIGVAIARPITLSKA